MASGLPYDLQISHKWHDVGIGPNKQVFVKNLTGTLWVPYTLSNKTKIEHKQIQEDKSWISSLMRDLTKVILNSLNRGKREGLPAEALGHGRIEVFAQT